jgi:hypothetical protein
MPELNEDGRAYMRRGLREEPGGEMSEMATEERERKPTQPAYTPRVLGEPLTLQWANYLSIMGHHMFIAERDERPTFDAGVVDLWAAGPFDTRWSALATPSFDIENGEAEVEQGYGHFITRWTDLFGSARFGQVLPFAVLLNQGGPRMPLTIPLVLSVPADTGSTWTPTTFVRGVELAGINSPLWNVYFGVGQPHLEDMDEPPGFERHTDIYSSAEWIFDRRGNSLTFYGYWGSSLLSPVATNQPFHRLGFFGNIYGSHTKGVLGYLAGSDDSADDRSLDNSGYFLLIEQLLSDRWAAYARYDHLRQDLDAGGSQNISGPTLGVSWWSSTETRLTLETQFLKTSDEPRDRMLMMEFLWAF